MLHTHDDYTQLMTNRIRKILLVCTNYDAFSLEEDGRIDVKIADEYQQLNLSNPPQITRVETVADAQERLQEESFDLLITMYNDHRTMMLRVQSTTDKTMDLRFCWNNSPDLVIAIIKLMEDRLNADHDILQEGVRAILLVEDSVRYYSTYLPLLYTLVLRQNSEGIQDALNEKQLILRKRARPKVMMATCYEEAVALYERYKQHILGVISDVGFVLHKQDDPSSEKLDAGIDLCHLIKADDPTMPFLMQSSQEAMRQVANRLGVGFVVKKSKTLTNELSEYIEREFGFGDFVVWDKNKEVARAHDLEAFERVISTIPTRLFRQLSDNNYLSKWLFARGLFALGRIIHRFRISDENDVESVRQANVRAIHDFRIMQECRQYIAEGALSE